MSKSISDLVGATIQSIEKVEDYFQLIMDAGVMNIFNPVTCHVLNEINQIELTSLRMRKIVNVEYAPSLLLKLEIDDKIVIEISLSEEYYSGPEAISLNYTSGEIIVFE